MLMSYIITTATSAGVSRRIRNRVLVCSCILLVILSSYSFAQQENCEPADEGSSNFHYIFLTDAKEDCYGNSSTSDLVQKAKELTQTLNQNISEFEIDLQVVPVCADSYHVTTRVSRLVLNQIPDSQSCQSGTAANNNSTLIGVIGPSDAYLADRIANSISETEIPFISYGEFVERVNPSDEGTQARHRFYSGTSLSKRAKAIAQLGVKLDWDYISILHDGNDFNTELVFLLQEALKSEHICYKDVYNIAILSPESLTANIDDAPHGLIILGSTQTVQGVIDSSKNAHTWITTASLTGLSVDQNTHKVYSIGYELESGEEVTPDLYPASAALISSTEALKSVVKTRCSGNVRDCLTIDRLELFKAISAQLDSLRIEPDINQVPSFLKLNRLGVLEFQDGVKLNQGINGQKAIIYEAQLLTANTAPQVIGSYADSVWDVTGVSNTRSWCTRQTCKDLCTQQIPPRDYIFVPGDFIVVMTAPVHVKKHDYPDQLKCYKFDKAFSLRAEAALYAVSQLEKKLNLKLGMLIFDTCYNSALAQNYLVDVFDGTTEYCNNEGECLDRKKVIALLGDYSSHVTIAEQHVNIPHNVIQLAWGAATSDLDDKSNFPLFLRLQPSQSRITKNMVQVLDYTNRQKKTDIQAVTLITTDSLYGITARKKMAQFLNDSGYCISHDYLLNQHDDSVTNFKTNVTITGENSAYQDLWGNLRNHPRIIIFNGDEDPLKRFLKVLKDDSALSEWWRGSGSFFMFAEGWDDRPELLDEYGDLFIGSISFKINATFEAKGFVEHLQNEDTAERKPSLNDDNPWFIRMYQLDQNCKYRGDFTSNETTACDTKRYAHKPENDILEVYNVLVIQGLTTLAYALSDYCKGDFADCNSVFARTEANAKHFLEWIRTAKTPRTDSLSDNDRELSSIDPNGDGKAGYICYQQQIDRNNKPGYFNILNFFKNEMVPDASDHFESTLLPVKFINGERNHLLDTLSVVCEPDKCAPTTCSAGLLTASPPPATTTEKTEQDTTLWIVISILCFILFLILLYIILRFLKKRRQRGGSMACFDKCLPEKPALKTSAMMLAPDPASITSDTEPISSDPNDYEAPPVVHSQSISFNGSANQGFAQSITGSCANQEFEINNTGNRQDNNMDDLKPPFPHTVREPNQYQLSADAGSLLTAAPIENNIEDLKLFPTAAESEGRYQTKQHSGDSVAVSMPTTRPKPPPYTRSASAGQINVPKRSAPGGLPDLPKPFNRSATVDHSGVFSRSPSEDLPYTPGEISLPASSAYNSHRGNFSRAASTDLPDLPECLSSPDSTDPGDVYLTSQPSNYVGTLPSGPDSIPLTLSSPQKVSTPRPLTQSEEYAEVY